MTFTTFLLFLLATVGCTHIIVDSSFFKGMRDFLEVKGWKIPYTELSLYDLVTCYQCAGTWVGFIWGFYMFSLLADGQWRLIDLPLILAFGCASSLMSVLAKSWMNYLNYTLEVPIDLPASAADMNYSVDLEGDNEEKTK